MANSVTAMIRDMWRSFAPLFDCYRPERHYMRGRGPKWHAKRAAAFANTKPSAADPGEVLGDIAKARA